MTLLKFALIGAALGTLSGWSYRVGRERGFTEARARIEAADELENEQIREAWRLQQLQHEAESPLL
jgi:hypothetical protein